MGRLGQFSAILRLKNAQEHGVFHMEFYMLPAEDYESLVMWATVGRIAIVVAVSAFSMLLTAATMYAFYRFFRS